MSKQRIINLRKSDLHIIRAFEMALIQAGVYDFATAPLPYVNILGNKEDGMVTVETASNSGRVYLRGRGEHFFAVSHVTFDLLDGNRLIESKPIWFDVGDEDLANIIEHATPHLQAIVYQLVAMAFDARTAMSVLYHLWKYPIVKSDGTDEYSFEFKVGGFHEVRTITVQYSRSYDGFVQAEINGDRLFVCDLLKQTWSEHIATQPEPIAEDEPDM